MKQRLFTLVLALVLFAVCGHFTARTTYAQCGASCAMICGNRCQYQCFDCGFEECIISVSVCCQHAYDGTGDTGPCEKD